MYIVVKSEMDSRQVVYPLMRCLKNFGSILVISNNRTLSRLIESPAEGGFRNIMVLVDSADSADEVCENYGITADDYDFIIVDNLGSSECDACILLAGTYVSPEFDDEIEMILNDENGHAVLFQFSSDNKKLVRKEAAEEESEDINEEDETPKQRRARLKQERLEQAARKKEERRLQKQQGKKEKEIKDGMGVPEDYDPAEKFRAMTAKQTVRVRKSVQVPFVTFQEIEKLEAEHVFYKVNPKMSDAFYELLRDVLAVSIHDFQVEVRKADEGGGNIRSRKSVR